MGFFRRLHDFFLPHERNGYHPHVFRLASLLVIAVVVLVLECGVVTQLAYVFPSTSFLASVLPGVLATLTNESRASAGVGSVTESPVLDHAAQLAANDMAAKGYFAHVSPSGTTPWDWLKQAGYAYSYAGENLAVNFTDSNALESAWMASPTHEANIVNAAYTQVGFAIATGTYEGKPTMFVVEFFGTPALSAAAPVSRPVVVAPKPETVRTAATTTGTIGGSEAQATSHLTNQIGVVTSAPVAPAGMRAAASPPRAPSASVLDRLLASPLSTVALALAVLFAFVAVLLIAAFLRHARMPHPRVLIAAAFLLTLTAGLVAANHLLTPGVAFPANDALSASVLSAFGG